MRDLVIFTRLYVIHLLIMFSLIMVSNFSMAAGGYEGWTDAADRYDLHAANQTRMKTEQIVSGNKHFNVAFFEVWPGDKFKNTTGERSEVVLGGWRANTGFRVNGTEAVEFYHISVKLRDDWRGPSFNSRGYQWGSFFQLHGPDEYDYPPSFALHAGDEFYVTLAGGDIAKSTSGKIYLKNGSVNAGSWVYFVVEAKWTTDFNGYIKIYRRDSQESQWLEVLSISNIPTLQTRGGEKIKPHYWKAGFYRSESLFVNRLWIGPIRRGNSFISVVSPS